MTTLKHLYRDYEEGPAWSYLDHVREYAEYWNFANEPHEDYVRKLVETNYSIHFHVWTQHDFLEMLIDIRRRLAAPVQLRSRFVEPRYRRSDRRSAEELRVGAPVPRLPRRDGFPASRRGFAAGVRPDSKGPVSRRRLMQNKQS